MLREREVALLELRRLQQQDLEAALKRSRTLFEGTSDPDERIAFGVMLADSLSRRGLLVEADELLKELSRLAKGDSPQQVQVLCQRARLDAQQGRLTGMLRRSALAHELSCEVGDSQLSAECLSVLAAACELLGLHEESMQHRMAELQIWQSIDEPAPVASLNSLAGLYCQLSRSAEAIGVADRCLERALEVGDRRLEAQVRGTRAQCLQALGRLAEAEAELLVGRDLLAGIGDLEAVIRQEIRLIGIQCDQGRLAEARQTRSRAMSALPAGSSPVLEAELLAAAARLFESEGAEAVERYTRALAWLETLGMGAQMAEMHEALYRIHKRAGRWKDALTHHEALLAVRGSLISERAEARMDALRVRYEVTRLEQERRISQLRNVELVAAYEQLQRLATTDTITGLFNRRHLDSRLVEECQRAERYGRPLSLMLFDIDHFKGINDGFGHAIGDRVLEVIGELVAQNTRDVDIAARHGGDEFAILFPDTDRQGAMQAGEKLRQIIAGRDWSDIAPGLTVTISGGVAERTDGTTLLEAADRQLYVSKRAGRDQISG